MSILKTVGLVGLVIVGGAWLAVKRLNVTGARIKDAALAAKESWAKTEEAPIVVCETIVVDSAAKEVV